MDLTTFINTTILPQLNSVNNVTKMLSQLGNVVNVITSVSMSVYSVFKAVQLRRKHILPTIQISL